MQQLSPHRTTDETQIFSRLKHNPGRGPHKGYEGKKYIHLRWYPIQTALNSNRRCQIHGLRETYRTINTACGETCSPHPMRNGTTSESPSAPLRGIARKPDHVLSEGIAVVQSCPLKMRHPKKANRPVGGDGGMLLHQKTEGRGASHLCNQ